MFRIKKVLFAGLAALLLVMPARTLAEDEDIIPQEEIREAAQAAWTELAAVRSDIQKEGERVLRYMEEHHVQGIVLAGRPYHIDP